MTDTQLPPEILSLSIEDRLELVERIWNSIAEDERDFQLTDAQRAELDRRIALHEANLNRGKPWDEIKKRLIGES